MNINEHIKEELINEYLGSEIKKTVILDDKKKYLLKISDPAREKNIQEALPYINNAISEYLGCKIIKSVGLPVQEVIFGEYTGRNGKTKLACLCADFKEDGEILHEFDKIALSEELITSASKTDKNDVTFELVENIIKTLPVSEKERQDIEDSYYKMFVMDAFIGNTDRHNGNWGVITKNNRYVRLAPIYDCGSCLLPLIPDQLLKTIDLNRESSNICSTIKENGTKINYRHFFVNNENKKVDKALLSIAGKINLKEISKIVNDTPHIASERKDFYNKLLESRYEQIIIPRLKRYYKNTENVNEGLNYYEIYKDYVKPIASLEWFEKTSLDIENKSLDFLRVNKKYALALNDNNEVIGLIPIRSKDNSVREFINAIEKLGVHLDLSKYMNNCISKDYENYEPEY